MPSKMIAFSLVSTVVGGGSSVPSVCRVIVFGLSLFAVCRLPEGRSCYMSSSERSVTSVRSDSSKVMSLLLSVHGSNDPSDAKRDMGTQENS